MSRAFKKDDDNSPEPILPRPISAAPNYVTPHGLELLRSALQKAESDGDAREAAYYRDRIDTAIVVEKRIRAKSSVEVGATVTARDTAGKILRVRVVGEDEADPLSGAISWQSPIAQALIGHKAGDTVVVQRPAGPIQYAIDDVRYE